jgi:hypothetical protein
MSLRLVQGRRVHCHTCTPGTAPRAGQVCVRRKCPRMLLAGIQEPIYGFPPKACGNDGPFEV